LAHDWGDSPEQINHRRIEAINTYFKSQGLTTWLDTTDNKGNMKDCIAESIPACHFFLVFLTANYNQKISKGIKEKDWCYYEYNYATQALVPEKMLLILLEPEMKKRSTWSKRIQADFANREYHEIFFDEELAVTDNIKESLDNLINDIKPLLIK
jgi:hypothetical protein